MDLPRTGREYATWTWTADVELDGVPEVCFLDEYRDTPAASTSWVPAEWSAEAEATTLPDGTPGWRRPFTLLLAGPSAPAGGPGATVLPLGTHWCMARVRDNPEVVVRRAGKVEVK